MKERRDVARSKRMLYNAYIDLLLEKGDETITVSEILKKADVARGTFYSHFEDINALKKYAEDVIIEKWVGIFSGISLPELKSNPIQPVSAFFSTVEEHRNELEILVRSSNNSSFIKKADTVILKILLSESDESRNPIATRLVCACIAGALVDATTDWLIYSADMKKEEVVSIVTDFISKGLKAFG